MAWLEALAGKGTAFDSWKGRQVKTNGGISASGTEPMPSIMTAGTLVDLFLERGVRASLALRREREAGKHNDTLYRLTNVRAST